MNDVIEILVSVIRTLETVEVKGKANLNAMLGSIQALEKVHAVMIEAKKKTAETKKEGAENNAEED